MLTIGFANEFYTLWDVSKEDIYSSIETASGTMSYKSGVKIHYWYQKNISKDLNKVKELYPNLKIDEELKGQSRSWSTTKEIDETPHILKFGKYVGKTVTEVANIDWNYFMWLIDNCHKFAIKQECLKVQKYIDFISDKERKEQETFAAINKIKENGIVELTFYTNPKLRDEYDNDFNGTVSAWAQYGNNNRIRVIFDKDQLNYIDGIYPYYTAMINGKFRRIKNKSFKVNVEVIAEYKLRTEFEQTVKIIK